MRLAPALFVIVATLLAISGCATPEAPVPTPFQVASAADPAPCLLPPANPVLARSHYDAGLSLQASGDLTPAAARFTDAAAARPRMADAYVHRSALRRDGAGVEGPRGFAGVETVERDGAREDAEQAMRVVTDKRHPDAWVARGDARRDAGQPGRAIEDYTEAIRIWPHYWVAFMRRGLVRYDAGDFKGAAEDFAARLALKPDDESRQEAALRLWLCRAKLEGRTAASAELRGRMRELNGESAEIAAFLVSGRAELEGTRELSERMRFYMRAAAQVK